MVYGMVYGIYIYSITFKSCKSFDIIFSYYKTTSTTPNLSTPEHKGEDKKLILELIIA